MICTNCGVDKFGYILNYRHYCTISCYNELLNQGSRKEEARNKRKVRRSVKKGKKNVRSKRKN